MDDAPRSADLQLFHKEGGVFHRLRAHVRSITLATLLALASSLQGAHAMSKKTEDAMKEYLLTVQRLKAQKVQEVKLKDHPELKKGGNKILLNLKEDTYHAMDRNDLETAYKDLVVTYQLGAAFGDETLKKGADALSREIWDAMKRKLESLREKFRTATPADLEPSPLEGIDITVRGTDWSYQRRATGFVFFEYFPIKRLLDDSSATVSEEEITHAVERDAGRLPPPAQERLKKDIKAQFSKDKALH
jgi:hypothetical protein